MRVGECKQNREQIGVKKNVRVLVRTIMRCRLIRWGIHLYGISYSIV